MAQSNRSAVEANNIPTDERLDLVIPRNGSLSFDVILDDIDDDDVKTPVDIAGCTITASAALSYQATHAAITATVSSRDDDRAIETPAFTLTYDAASAKGLGIDVVDLVHDLVIAPSGGGEPRRFWSGLMTLSKGVPR